MKENTHIGLKMPYIAVEGTNGASYGGNQRLAKDRGMQKYGCGIVAAADTLFYIQRSHPGCRLPLIVPRAGVIPLDLYRQGAERLRREYFPLIPGFGLNVLVLAAGIERILRRGETGLRARWGVKQSLLWERMEEMLAQNLPVILCIGQRVPAVWNRKGLRLYTRSNTDVYCAVRAVSGHFVTVTGMDQNWLRISSWGREMYISRRELSEYMRRVSNPLLTNILYLYR